MSGAVLAPGVYLDGRRCLFLWQALCRLDASRLHPEVAEAKEHMRSVASTWLAEQQAMSAAGHRGRTSPDITGRWNQAHHDATAAEIAATAGVTARHVRRVATTNGIAPASTSPYRWTPTDAAAIRGLIAH